MLNTSRDDSQFFSIVTCSGLSDQTRIVTLLSTLKFCLFQAVIPDTEKTEIYFCTYNGGKMKKYFLLVITLVMLTLSGCAARNAKIVIDPQGVDMGHYQADLARCQQISMQVESEVGKGLVGGAAVGAIAGNIIGGSDRTRKGAKLGALGGVVKAGAATKRERVRVVKNCLRTRGYAVLN